MTTSDLEEYVRETIVENGLGIFDADQLEIQKILDHRFTSSYILSDMISRRAQIGWSTHGHSAVDVNIYGSAGADALRGNHENIEVGQFLREYLDVDVDAVTRELIEKSAGEDLDKWTIVSEEDGKLLVESEHWPVEFGEL